VPVITPAQTNFTAGELSPRLFGREDIARYAAGVAELENWRVMPHGGADRRTGLRFVAEVKDSAKRVRLLPFEYSVEQAYVLELGDAYMRVYKDGGQVEVSPGSPYEISTPFAEAALFELQRAQTADVMYIAHKDYYPRKLTRTGHTSWTLAQVPFVDGPYLPANTTGITITPSATTGTITLTASSAVFNAGHAPVGGEPGALWRITHGAASGYVRITAVASGTSATAVVLSNLSATTATSSWREGAWSSYRGFPRAVAFFEQRLYFGGTSYQPQTLWGSAVGAYEDHTPGVADDDPVNYTIASQKQTAIQWLESKDVLFIGTASAEFTAGDPTAPLTPTNVRIVPQTTYGSTYLQPVRVSSVVLFVQRSRRKLREMAFEFRDDAYRAQDVSLLAEHITAGGLVQLDYAQEPDSIVWAVRADGVLLGLTYDREQEVLAWQRHTTDGEFESVASIPVSAASGTEGYDQTWVVVRRTVNGTQRRYIEYLTERFDLLDDITEAFFVDSGLTYDGPATSVLSGLTHLEGKEVAILGDGAVQPRRTVSGGSITLERPASKAAVGLPYRSIMKTLPGVVGAPAGNTAQGRAKSWGDVKARVHRTVGLMIDGERVTTRSAADPMDTALEPFTGIKEVQLDGWDTEAQLVVEQDLPLPATVLALFGTLQVTDL